MPTYVITGASRGIGWGFLEHLSASPSNFVIGLVRDAPGTKTRVINELPNRSNITILQADLIDQPALKKAASVVADITGGSVDYLIGNAAYLSLFDAFDGPGDLLANVPYEQFAQHFHAYMDTNVLGQIYLYEAFLPLILKGETKKVVSISSGLGDPDFNREWEHDQAVLYAASKAALNMVNVKFVSPEQTSKWQAIGGRFQAYSPNFTGPVQPVDSVKAVLAVAEQCSVENGDSGKFLSHLGSKRWLP